MVAEAQPVLILYVGTGLIFAIFLVLIITLALVGKKQLQTELELATARQRLSNCSCGDGLSPHLPETVSTISQTHSHPLPRQP